MFVQINLFSKHNARSHPHPEEQEEDDRFGCNLSCRMHEKVFIQSVSPEQLLSSLHKPFRKSFQSIQCWLSVHWCR